MTTKDISLKQALNKAYRLIKPKRSEMEAFKRNLISMLGQIDEKESEENVKIHLMNFMRDTFYHPAHLLATKGKADFVAHTGKEANSPAGVLFEVKRPLNTADMVSKANLNAKAMHELILYYLRERIEHKNNSITNLVITNIYEWYVFDASVFERLFHKNTGLVKQYKEWAAGQKVSSRTDLFYNEIAKPFLNALEEEIPFTWFDIRAFEKPLKNADKADDKALIPLFKVLSPVHLLKLPFANDSNTLDKGFYAELLHLIGLEEVKDGSKKIIRRKKAGERNEGSLLENAITILETENCLHKVPDLKSYGDEKEDQLFSVGLELCITWINRILFLKLLEAQLLKYHKNNTAYRFLNFGNLPQYDEVYKLFFQVLARRHNERSEKVQNKFSHVPYLNSSLFEFSDMEDATIKINMLDDTAELPLITSTVLRNDKNKPKADKLNTLQYLFEFLDAYDFASEGEEDIQEEGKTLINASVLGLIFEKINGYKDGSIFTPGFITMYMCRQSIRQAIHNKFTETYHWTAASFADLRNYISEDRSAATLKKYNELVNSLTICDPAVGSGHFLVSALNEMIAVKAELGILINSQGQRLTDADIALENDELLVYDEKGDPFAYTVEIEASGQLYTPPKKQDIQKTLFHEKQTIIENCLFGVDINPKSVQICRLRLWIELLKNAYYIIPEGQSQNSSRIGSELQTLPNIDINIKCGNSLISRFSTTEDLKAATPYFEKKILEYKSWVADYKNEVDKDKKRGILQLMKDLKTGFISKITDRNPTKIKLIKLNDEFLKKYVNEKLFSDNLTAAQKKDKDRLDKEIKKLNEELEAYIKNPVFTNSFEWRFEFPEVLNEKGDFIGFDVVIGNPPYGIMPNKNDKEYLLSKYVNSRKVPDSYLQFIELITHISKPKATASYIVPNTFCDLENCDDFRKWLLSNYQLEAIMQSGFAFDNAVVATLVIFLKNQSCEIESLNIEMPAENYERTINSFIQNRLSKIDYRNKESENKFLKSKTYSISTIGSIISVKAGVKLYEVGKGVPQQTKKTLKERPYTVIGEEPKGWRNLVRGTEIVRYFVKPSNEYVNYGEWLAAPRDKESFEGDRLVMRRTDDKILTAYINDDSVCVNSCHILKFHKPAEIELDYKVVLALLNSKFYQKVFELQNPQMIDKPFAEIKVVYVENLPYKEINQKLQKALIALVDKIHERKKNGVDTTTLEMEIDNLVYKIYDLTPEEIKIIEGAV